MSKKKEENFTDFFTAGFRLLSQQNPIGIIYLLLAIVFSGTEASKIFFRRKFAKGTVGVRQIVTFSLLLGGWAYLCYRLKLGAVPDDSDTFNISILLYSVLSILLLIKGIFDWNKSETTGRGFSIGESTLLSFLNDSCWSEQRIKNVAEPIFWLSIAAPLSLISIYLGAPLLFLGISVFVFNLFEIKEETEDSHLKASPGRKGRVDEEKDRQFPQ